MSQLGSRQSGFFSGGSSGGGGGGGTVNSVGLTMPSAFSVGGTNPITNIGTFIVSGSGTTFQYIDGTGALQTFPTIPSITNLVPYSGATQNVTLGEFGITTGYTQYDTSPTTYTPSVGNIGWNSTFGTLEFKLLGGNVTLQIGQKQVVYARNNDSVTITIGQPVYINSGGSLRPFVKLASNTLASTSNRTIGIANESIVANGFGFITTRGVVEGLNTSTFTLGDLLYVGSVAGTLTNVKPIAPNYSVLIGVCAKVDATDGHIYVNPSIISNLSELSDVFVPTTPTSNDGVFWDSANARWRNASVSTALGYTPANASTIANASQNGLLSSSDWSYFSDGIQLQTFKLLGSTILSQSMNVMSLSQISTGSALQDASFRISVVYLPISATLTGVKFYQTVQGDYTGDAYNGIGLYTISSGTMTLVASTTNDANFWKGTGNTWITKPFSSTYAATSRVFIIGFLYNSSAQVTAPSVGVGTAMQNAALSSFDFTNSVRLSGILGGQSTLPTPQAMSGLLGSNINYGFWLY